MRSALQNRIAFYRMLPVNGIRRDWKLELRGKRSFTHGAVIESDSFRRVQIRLAKANILDTSLHEKKNLSL